MLTWASPIHPYTHGGTVGHHTLIYFRLNTKQLRPVPDIVLNTPLSLEPLNYCFGHLNQEDHKDNYKQSFASSLLFSVKVMTLRPSRFGTFNLDTERCDVQDRVMSYLGGAKLSGSTMSAYFSHCCLFSQFKNPKSNSNGYCRRILSQVRT